MMKIVMGLEQHDRIYLFKRGGKGCLHVCVQRGKGKRLQADGLCSEISAELWEGSGTGQGQGSKQTYSHTSTHTAEGL